MAGVTGREVSIAFAKFATNSWGVAASVTKGIYFASDGGLTLTPQILTDDAFGQTFLGPHDVGNITPPALSWQASMRYADHAHILEALAMGSPAAPAIATSASGQTTSWTHQMDLSASIDGLGITAAIDRVRYVEELTSAKVHGFDVENGDGGIMRETFRIIGAKTTNISSINVAATVSGADFPALQGRVLMKQGVFRMNVQAGGSLTASDAVAAESIKFSFNRPQDAPNIFGQDYVAEPADNGFPTFALELTYPRMTAASANSLYAGLREATNFKADWTFSGAYINSTDQQTVRYQFPHAQVTTFETPVTGANQVKPKVMFALYEAAAAPTGMSGITAPVRLTRIMQNSVTAF